MKVKMDEYFPNHQREQERSEYMEQKLTGAIKKETESKFIGRKTEFREEEE